MKWLSTPQYIPANINTICIVRNAYGEIFIAKNSGINGDLLLI